MLGAMICAAPHGGNAARSHIPDPGRAWLRLCRSTDEAFVVDPIATLSTYPRQRFGWPPVKGSTGDAKNGNETHANIKVEQAGNLVVRVAKERGRLCPDGEVFNPFDSSCRPQLPIFSLFPQQQLAPSGRGSAMNSPRTIRDWHGNVRPWTWDCEKNTYKHPYMSTNPARMLQCLAADGAAVEPIIKEEYFEWGHSCRSQVRVDFPN